MGLTGLSATNGFKADQTMYFQAAQLAKKRAAEMTEAGGCEGSWLSWLPSSLGRAGAVVVDLSRDEAVAFRSCHKANMMAQFSSSNSAELWLHTCFCSWTKRHSVRLCTMCCNTQALRFTVYLCPGEESTFRSGRD